MHYGITNTKRTILTGLVGLLTAGSIASSQVPVPSQDNATSPPRIEQTVETTQGTTEPVIGGVNQAANPQAQSTGTNANITAPTAPVAPVYTVTPELFEAATGMDYETFGDDITRDGLITSPGALNLQPLADVVMPAVEADRAGLEFVSGYTSATPEAMVLANMKEARQTAFNDFNTQPWYQDEASGLTFETIDPHPGLESYFPVAASDITVDNTVEEPKWSIGKATFNVADETIKPGITEDSLTTYKGRHADGTPVVLGNIDVGNGVSVEDAVTFTAPGLTAAQEAYGAKIQVNKNGISSGFDDGELALVNKMLNGESIGYSDIAGLDDSRLDGTLAVKLVADDTVKASYILPIDIRVDDSTAIPGSMYDSMGHLPVTTSLDDVSIVDLPDNMTGIQSGIADLGMQTNLHYAGLNAEGSHVWTEHIEGANARQVGAPELVSYAVNADGGVTVSRDQAGKGMVAVTGDVADKLGQRFEAYKPIVAELAMDAVAGAYGAGGNVQDNPAKAFFEAHGFKVR